MIKKFIKKYFESFAYFYSYLRYRVFIVITLSILIGIMDGLGLSMFLPLLQMVSNPEGVDSESLGRLSFLLDFFKIMKIPISLIAILGLMLVFFCVKGSIQYAAGIYKVNVQQWFIKRLRAKNIRGLNNLDYKYFVTSDVGRIQNTLTGEVTLVASSYKSYFDALQYGILVAVYMGFAFYVNAQFAILVSLGGALTNFLFKKLYQKTKGASRELTGENNIFQSLIIQNVANYKYLKATGSLKDYGQKLQESVARLEDTNRKIGQLDAILNSAREPILVLVVVVVIYIQTSLLGSQLGELLISLVFFYRALTYLMQMQIRWNKFLGGAGSLENTQLFTKELNQNKERNGTLDINNKLQQLNLKDISFYYGEEPVLENISLTVKNNETLAFVGESGSGKTTLVNILAGLLPISSGSFFVNGNIEFQDVKLNSFQKKIGYITQDPVIFGDTVFNNVSFWDEKNDENLKRFWRAVKQAAILNFINELPSKEDTILGNNGVNLSGGQRQRISIARELYKQVEILILDEATSALDSETEKAIQENIDALQGDYTILIVAHRIATIKNADRIVLMNKGKITDIGGFRELIAKSPYFKKLVELQEL